MQRPRLARVLLKSERRRGSVVSPQELSPPVLVLVLASVSMWMELFPIPPPIRTSFRV
jgi:hypothetical protein